MAAKRPVLMIGSSTDCPDIEYATGFRAADPVVFLRAGRRTYLVVPEFERNRAERAGKRTHVLSPGELRRSGKRLRRIEEWALCLVKKLGIAEVSVPGTFPLAVARYLERHSVRVHVAKEGLFTGRAVKTKEELRNMREAQQAAVIAMRGVVACIAESEPDSRGYLRVDGERLTVEGLRETIRQILLQRNCFAEEVIVAPGPQSADPHEAGRGPLRNGEAVVIDIFPQHLGHRYCGDLTRTVVRGKPAVELKRMYQAVKAAQGEALSCLRAGVKCSTVHSAAVEEFERRGFETKRVAGTPAGFTHSTGHGVGLSIHEMPSVGPNGTRLRRGNVVTVEPGLYYPGIGGVRIEDTVEVTADGWRYLAPCEKRFEL
ncbi:M24 family metallopeptidase [Verrucomicrobiota bacterium]